MKFSIFVVLLLAYVGKEVASQACHLREVDLCLAIGMFHFQSNGVPEDEEKIDEFCETYKEVMECMGNFSNKCMSPLQREMIGLLSGADEPALRLCTRGSEVRSKYLKHGSCLSEAAENDNFKDAMKDLQTALENVFDIPFYDRLPGLCCGLKRFNEDIDRNTEESCGRDAVEMTKYIMNMLTTELPDVICQRFDPNGEECQNILPPPGSPGKAPEKKSQLGKLLDTMFGNL